MGLFVVIGSDFIVELIFILFPPISLLFFVILLLLFIYLDIPPSRQVDEINHSSFEGRSVYDFVDTTQNNYDQEETDPNILQKQKKL